MAEENNQTTVVEKDKSDKSSNAGVIVAVVAIIAIIILLFIGMQVFGGSGDTDVNVTPTNPDY